jgi:hypothetical protein
MVDVAAHGSSAERLVGMGAVMERRLVRNRGLDQTTHHSSLSRRSLQGIGTGHPQRLPGLNGLKGLNGNAAWFSFRTKACSS